MEEGQRILAQFVSEKGEATGAPFDLPLDVSTEKLQLICNAILQQEDTVPYAFYVDEKEITSTLSESLSKEDQETEQVLSIIYQPQALFKVRAVTRCTSTIEGHAEAVISVAFSPDGRYLASGSGDTTVRFWDVTTETPHHTCKGHKHWVLCIAWSPDGRRLASGCKNSQIIIWNPETGKQEGKVLTGHKQWITWLAWQPFHVNHECRLLASASKDGNIKVWDVVRGCCLRTLSGHLQSVTCIRWGGTDLIYSASQDRTVKVWRAADGILCRTLQGHGHWVNTMALSTDYVLRTSWFDPMQATINHQRIDQSAEELSKIAKDRYDTVKGSEPERLVTGSDDFTLFLWQPEKEKTSVARMTGHMQLINDVAFSPDTRLVASASFDKSIKLWNGHTGKFITTLRGHVSKVYQVSWSSDSRLLCSGSSDSTLKVWDVASKAIKGDLPGHADEVYAVDWSPDGQRVASGGKDKVLKIWRR